MSNIIGKIQVLIYLIIILLLGYLIFFIIGHLKTLSNGSILAGPTEVNLITLWNQKEYKEIIDYAEGDLEINRFDFNLNLLLGFSYFYYSLMLNEEDLRNEYLDKAIGQLRYLIAINDTISFGPLYYILGKAYAHKGKYYAVLAVRYLKKSLNGDYFNFINIEEAVIYEYLGHSYQLLGDYHSSLKFFEKAYSKNNSDLILWSLAYINYKLGFIDSSVSYMDKIIKDMDFRSSNNELVDENLVQKVYLLYGDIYFDKLDYDKALSYYEKILTINSSNASVYVKIGDVYRKRDRDYPMARKYWRNSLQINPHFEEAINRLSLNRKEF